MKGTFLKFIHICVTVIILGLLLGLALRGLLTKRPIHMDCTWEAWQDRSVPEIDDPREAAVAQCAQILIRDSYPPVPEVCEQYRSKGGLNYKIEMSDLDMAKLNLEFLHNIAGACQCVYHDGSFYFDIGAWNSEAIRLQEMLIESMEQSR